MDNLENIQPEEIDRWFYRYAIPASAVDGVSIKEGFYPPAGYGLPYKGYYHVDVHVNVIEDPGPTPGANVLLPQTLEIQGKNDSLILLDKSVVYVPVTPPNTDKVVNYSLQGSAIVLVDSDVEAERYIYYKVTLPNGTTKQLTGGYIHVEYIGPSPGELVAV